MPSATEGKSGAPKKRGPQGENTGRWTSEEHSIFVKGLEQHGKEWKEIANMIPTRTVVQIRTHAQKYFQKLQKLGQPHPIQLSPSKVTKSKGPTKNAGSKRPRSRSTSVNSASVGDNENDVTPARPAWRGNRDGDKYTTPIRHVVGQPQEEMRGGEDSTKSLVSVQRATNPPAASDFSADMEGHAFTDSAPLGAPVLHPPVVTMPQDVEDKPGFGQEARRAVGVQRIVVGGRSFPSSQFDESDEVPGFFSVGQSPQGQFSGKAAQPYAPSGARLVLQVSGGTVTSVTRMSQFDSHLDDSRRNLNESAAHDVEQAFDLFPHEEKGMLDDLDSSAHLEPHRMSAFLHDRGRTSTSIGDRMPHDASDDIAESELDNMLDEKAIEGWLSEGSVDSGSSVPSAHSTASVHKADSPDSASSLLDASTAEEPGKRQRVDKLAPSAEWTPEAQGWPAAPTPPEPYPFDMYDNAEYAYRLSPDFLQH